MPLVAGGILISINWGVYVLAVTTGHVIDTSLGYFITPLVNVLFAVWILRERLSRPQAAAMILATAGVLYLAWQLGHPPWIALILACRSGSMVSFASSHLLIRFTAWRSKAP